MPRTVRGTRAAKLVVMGQVGRLLLLFGMLLLLFGGLLPLLDKLGGRMPGDLVLRGRNWTVYLPLGTSLLLSLLLSLLWWLFFRR